MTPNQITVSQAAIRQARNCGINGDTEARVRGIAANASPTPSETANASYGPFLLLMRGNHVEAFSMAGPQSVDDRPVADCKICGGMMTYAVRASVDGREGIAQRPCPRAFDPTQPLCDTKRRTTR